METSANRLLLVFLLLFGILLLSGCVFPPAPQPTPVPYYTPTPAPSVQMACNQYPTLAGVDQCNYEYALSNADPQNCWRISNASLRDTCLAEFAARFKNESICGQMFGAGSKNSCYASVALLKNNTLICDRLPTVERRDCHLSLNDTSVLCEGLLNGSYQRALCFADAKLNVSFCSPLEGSGADSCRHEYALAHNDSEACKEISDAGMMAGCSAELALRLSDFHICESISEAWARDSCLTQFFDGNLTAEFCYGFADENVRLPCLAKAQANLHVCDLFNDTARIDLCLEEYAEYFRNATYCSYVNLTSYANSCYTNLSVALLQPDLCMNATPELERDKCFRDYAVSTMTIEVCDRIILDSIRMPCQSDVAYEFDDPAFCNRIQQISYFKERCYGMIIERATYDPLTCKNIEMGKWQSECYMRAAIRLNDSSLCEKIQDPLKAQACRGEFP